MDKDSFNVLLLVGRPASSKSEIIDFLTGLEVDVLRRRYHLKTPDIIDDFPLLGNWFEEDEILSTRLERPRLYTDEHGNFLNPSF